MAPLPPPMAASARGASAAARATHHGAGSPATAALRAGSLVLLLAAALACAPSAAAQGHVHDAPAGITIVSDLGPSGVAHAGALSHFTLVAFGGDHAPDFHQDLPMRVTLDGAVVLELDADAGHDYDGVRDAWVTFGRPGRYAVEAIAEDGTVAARLEGDVLPAPGSRGSASLEVQVGAAGLDGHALAWRFQRDGGGPRDFLADVRHGSRVVASAQLRGAEGAAQAIVAPTGAGEYRTGLMHFDAAPADVANPVLPGGLFASAAMAGTGPAPLRAPPTLAVPPEAANAIVASPEGPLQLVATYDPWTSVGTSTLQTLGVLGIGSDGHLVPGLRLDARVTDAAGRVLWQSADGYAPSGAWSLATLQGAPGLYVLRVAAEAPDGARATLDVPWRVTPPVEPASAGPVAIAVEGLDGLVAGVASAITLRASDATAAFPHTDILLDVYGQDPGGKASDEPSVLRLRTKLHTHGDGVYRALVALPFAEQVRVVLTPSPLEARPVVLGDYEFAAGVAASPAVPDVTPPLAPVGDAQPVPMVPLPFLLVALAGLAPLARRRRD